MGWTWKRNLFPQVRLQIEEGAAAAVRYAAATIEERAKDLVPSPEHPGPYATGALQAAIYAHTDEHNGYDEAIADAKAAPGTRIVKQNQILPSLPLPAFPPGVYAAAVRAPLSYAPLIEHGFSHYRSGKHIAGRSYLLRAAEEETDEFRELLEKMLKGVQIQRGGGGAAGMLARRRTPPRPGGAGRARRVMSEEDMREAWMREYNRDKRRMERQLQRERMERIAASGVPMRRIRSSSRGHYETFSEMWERLERDANDAFERNRSGGGF